MRKRNLFILLLSSLLGVGCTDVQIGQPATDGVAPGEILDYTVKNISGGAVIKYKVPSDKDLLYVKAFYTINGVEKTTSSSVYCDSLVVRGFGSEEEQMIRLCCVDRSNNVSDPVEVKIKPLTPPITLIQNSFNIEASFGGVKMTWENKEKSDVVIYAMTTDSLGQMYVADEVYTNSKDGAYALRGFANEKRLFAVLIRDRWDNYSDTIKSEQTPLFEEELDKTLFKRYELPGDNLTSYPHANYQFEKMFDGIVGDQGWHTGDPQKPIYCTIDLGVTAQLSRHTLWHRLGNISWYYAHFNPKKWTVWGTNQIKAVPEEEKEDYWINGGFKDDWYKLAELDIEPPSGQMELTPEDIAFADKGFESEMPLEIEPVRYIRFHFEETYAGGTSADAVNVSEISFWGKIIK